MLTSASIDSSRSAAMEPDVVNRRAPAVLTSILVHFLVLLALPLFDLPAFRHGMSIELEVDSTAQAELGDQPITQVILSVTLPDSEEASIAEQFAAKQANLDSAGGGAGIMQTTEPDAITSIETSIQSPQQGELTSGPSEFDPAGTRDSLPSRTDLALLIPDERLSATPLLKPSELCNAVNQEQSLAIAAALRWIISQQTDRGFWPMEQRLVLVDDQVAAAHNRRVSATSLALLPLIAMQQTHESGQYATHIQRAVDFLLAPDADPVNSDTEAQRALALTELFIVTRDSRIRAGAKQAIDKVVKNDYRQLYGNGTSWPSSSSHYSGSWPTRHRCIYTWQIFAMRAGEFAGLQANSNVIPTFRLYASSPVASAYSSVDLRSSYFSEQAELLITAGCAKNGEVSVESDYLSTLFLARTAVPEYREWTEKTTEYLLSTQNKLYPHTGSWTAQNKDEDDLRATIFSTLILSVPSESTVVHRRP